jgi:tetratricopeptide (TPR) repeat protein
MNKFNFAIDDWKQYINHHPHEGFVLDNIGKVYLMLNDFNQAAEWFVQAIKVNPFLG